MTVFTIKALEFRGEDGVLVADADELVDGSTDVGAHIVKEINYKYCTPLILIDCLWVPSAFFFISNYLIKKA